MYPSAALGGVPWLIGLQVFSRVVVTFALNRAVLRLISPDVFGIGAVQMQLLLTTSLFLGRETFRRAAQRENEAEGKNDGDGLLLSLRLARLSVPVGAVVCIIVCNLFLFVFGSRSGRSSTATAASESVPAWDYVVTVLLFGAATIIELLAEPFYVLSLVSFQVKRRVLIEGGGVMLRALVTYIFVSAGRGVVAFGIGQLVYAVILLFGFGFIVFWADSSRFSAALRFSTADLDFRGDGFGFVLVYAVQTLLKYLLQEGERLVLVALQSAFDQGVYGIAVNLGSLMLRLVFQPVEEVTFTSCARIRDAAVRAHLVSVMLKGVVLIGAFAASWGTGLAYAVIRLLYDSKWSDATNAPAVLAWYCIYVLTCAANGVTEAAAQACGSRSDLAQQNVWLAVNSAVYIALCVAGVTYNGTIGLVWAGCVAMVLRTVQSIRFIPQLRITAALPKPMSVLVMGLAGAWVYSISPVSPIGPWYNHYAHANASASANSSNMHVEIDWLRLVLSVASGLVVNVGAIVLTEWKWVMECKAHLQGGDDYIYMT